MNVRNKEQKKWDKCGGEYKTPHVASSERLCGQWSWLSLLSDRAIVTSTSANGMQPTALQRAAWRNNRLCLQADNIWRLVCCLTAFWMRVTMYLPLGTDSCDMTGMTDRLSRRDSLASWPQKVVTWGAPGGSESLGIRNCHACSFISVLLVRLGSFRCKLVTNRMQRLCSGINFSRKAKNVYAKPSCNWRKHSNLSIFSQGWGSHKSMRCYKRVMMMMMMMMMITIIVIPRLTKIIRSGITFVSRNVISRRFL